MSIKIRGANDEKIASLADRLARYELRHPRAEIQILRKNVASIHVRIVDPDFEGIDRADRHDAAWEFIAELPESVQCSVSVLLLLTPDEATNSFASSEFDPPMARPA